MRFLQQTCAAAVFSLLAVGAMATPANPQNGADYLTLQEAQQTNAAGKVEIIEFFSYACPHCNAFEPALAEWVKKQDGRIAFKRVPLSFRIQWVPLQKMYYTLEALGKTEEMHAKVFAAIHRDRMRFDGDQAVADIAVKIGIDRKQFTDVYQSFAVQAKASRAERLQEAYKVSGVPMLIVDGRYQTSPGVLSEGGLRQTEEQLFASTLQVVDYLMGKASKK